jgi:hypothetical protein
MQETDAVYTPTWRSLVTEDERDKMVGKLVRQHRDAEIGYATIDRKIKEIGKKLENLGDRLSSSVTGGDYRDLLGFLEQTGVGVSSIKQLLDERNGLASAIHQYKQELGALGA